MPSKSSLAFKASSLNSSVIFALPTEYSISSFVGGAKGLPILANFFSLAQEYQLPNTSSSYSSNISSCLFSSAFCFCVSIHISLASSFHSGSGTAKISMPLFNANCFLASDIKSLYIGSSIVLIILPPSIIRSNLGSYTSSLSCTVCVSEALFSISTISSGFSSVAFKASIARLNFCS